MVLHRFFFVMCDVLWLSHRGMVGFPPWNRWDLKLWLRVWGSKFWYLQNPPNASVYEVYCKKLAKIYRFFLGFQWISILIHSEFSYMTQKYPLVQMNSFLNPWDIHSLFIVYSFTSMDLYQLYSKNTMSINDHINHPIDLPSGKLTKNYGKSSCFMGKSTINGHFQ
jgi:hypothetical protein